MAKIIDITDKLSFEENPQIVVKDKAFTVNADAETMLKIMGVFSEEGGEMEATLKAYNLLFSEQDRKVITKMKLPFKDLLAIISAAMELVQGESTEGE